MRVAHMSGQICVSPVTLMGDYMAIRTACLAGASLLGLTLALGAAPATALAQDAQTASTESRRLETVVVTARKAEESLEDAPVAVTAFTSDAIANLGIDSIDDIARFTPGLSFSKTFGRATDRPVIRGQANILAGVQAGVEAGAAYFIDGVYFSGDLQSLDPNEIERVEVIKGPQSALYGRNTYSGAINYITRSPGDTFSYSGRISAAEGEEYNAAIRIAGPLAENLSGSLSGRYYSKAGFVRNTATGEMLGSEETLSFAGVLDWRPLDSLSIRARLSYNDDDDGPRAFGFLKSDFNTCFPGFRSNAFRGNPATTNNNPNQYFCGVLPPQTTAAQNTGANGTIPGSPFMGVKRELFTGSVIANIDLPRDHRVVIQYGFRDDERFTGSDSDFQNGFSPFTPATNPPASNSLFQLADQTFTDDYSLEVRVESPSDNRFRWLIGGYFYAQTIDNYQLNFAFTRANGYRGPINSISKTDNTALFGRLSFDITDNLVADAEIRSAVETKSVREFGSGLTAASPLGVVLYDGRARFENVTPRATLTWTPTPDLTVYGIFAQGVKPGGLNGLIGQVNNRNAYLQEKSDNWELGVKSTFWDGRARLNVAAFAIEASDYQLTTTIADLSGASATGLTSVVTNQASAEIKGVEFDLAAVLTDHLDIGLTYAWTDPTFKEGCDEFQYVLTSGGWLMSATPNRPLNPAATPLPGASCSIAGKRVPLTSEHQASANFNYERPIMAGAMDLFVRGDVSYESSKFIQVHNLMETGEATIFGAKLGVKGSWWEVNLFGKNLSDEDAVPMGTRWFDLFQGASRTPTAPVNLNPVVPVGGDTGAPRAAFIAIREPRQVGIEIKFRN